ncbi:MAG: hypothetical protein ABI416_08620 [Ginsengibacter sp.]
MKYLELVFFALLFYNNAMFAQARRSIRVKAGENIAQAYSSNGFYRFPKFGNAMVFYKDGRQINGECNYNLLTGNMQFIHSSGKPLDIDTPSNVDSIAFEKNIFVQDDGFLEIVAQSGSIKLLKKIIIKTRVEKIGALGLPAQSVSIDNLTTYSADTDVYNLVSNSDIVVIENLYLYWMEATHIIKATKGNLLKLLPSEKKSAVDIYMKQHKINFDDENDLKELLTGLGGDK